LLIENASLSNRRVSLMQLSIQKHVSALCIRMHSNISHTIDKLALLTCHMQYLSRQARFAVKWNRDYREARLGGSSSGAAHISHSLLLPSIHRNYRS
jgi:hypothetical protein